MIFCFQMELQGLSLKWLLGGDIWGSFHKEVSRKNNVGLLGCGGEKTFLKG